MDFNIILTKIEDFTKTDHYYKRLFFSNALAGEVGEFCNLVKKYYRDGELLFSNIKEELADIFIYLVLNAKINMIDLEKAILDKIKNNEKRK